MGRDVSRRDEEERRGDEEERERDGDY